MKTKQYLLSTIAIITFLISACGSSAPSTEVPMAATMTTQDTPVAGSAMKIPAWYSASFVDARTGESFAIQDLKGKVVLVEAMAIWCTNCLKQQGQVKALNDLINKPDDFVRIGLDIDPNENISNLKTYVETKGFDWLYSVSTKDVSREIASLYGDQFLNPPSTPIVIIDRHGSARPMPFGIKSTDDLLKFIQPFLDEPM